MDQRIFDSLFFPRGPHTRNEDPGPYASYKSYKPHLQREFRRKCVYCRVSDGPAGDHTFGVDHYLPQSRFPLLTQVWSNLYYSCSRCNTLKSDFISTPELYLPNPCRSTMAEHLQYEDSNVVAYTKHGECLAELLCLKETKRRKRRDLIMAALRGCLMDRHDLLRELTSYESMVEKGEGDRETLEALAQEAAEELERVDGRIELLTGEPVDAGDPERRAP